MRRCAPRPTPEGQRRAGAGALLPRSGRLASPPWQHAPAATFPYGLGAGGALPAEHITRNQGLRQTRGKTIRNWETKRRTWIDWMHLLHFDVRGTQMQPKCLTPPRHIRPLDMCVGTPKGKQRALGPVAAACRAMAGAEVATGGGG